MKKFVARLIPSSSWFLKRNALRVPFVRPLVCDSFKLFHKSIYCFERDLRELVTPRDEEEVRKGILYQPPKHKMKFFDEVLDPEFLSALQQLGITAPSEIQRLAIPEILKGDDILCAAQTGTGKTLAYLLPVLMRMKQDEVTWQS